MITKKSIKELVELVEEGKLKEIVFEDEIERIKYFVFKNEIGVGIQKTDMDNSSETTNSYRKTILQRPSDPLLEKAMDYLINPYPKVSDYILSSYKSTLSDELHRIKEIEKKNSEEADQMKENLKILNDIVNDNIIFKETRQKLLDDLKFDLAQRGLAGEHIYRIKSAITDFINDGD